MAEITESKKLEDKLLLFGRAIICFMALVLPLAFCRETMYIFQIKTMVLQYSGFVLLCIIIIHNLIAKKTQNIFHTWCIRFMIGFVCWQIFKSWDSISPIISWRQMSRIFWLPVFAISIAYFFRNRAQLERLITVIVITAVIANIYMWLLYHETSFKLIFGQPVSPRKAPFDFASIPIIGQIAHYIFYPQPFDAYIAKKDMSLPMSMYSLFAGKPKAGTFGSLNFITGYLNLTSILMIYRSTTLIKEQITEEKKNSGLKIAIAIILILFAVFSYYHIMQLGNRGSQIGMFLGFFSLFIYALIKLWKRISAELKLGLLLMGLSILGSIAFTTYSLGQDRFLSIFTIQSPSNELRIHTWGAFMKGYLGDNDQWPSGSKWSKYNSWRLMTGIGTYCFRVMYPKYRIKRIFQIEFNQHNTETSHPHNEYLGYLGELGLIGLLTYLSMIAFLLYLLLKKNEDDDLMTHFLKAAILFALISQLAHQGVGVGVRYTGVASQFWLIIGLTLALASAIPTIGQTSPQRKYLLSGCFAAAGLIVMPNLAFPLQWFRSQHFYEMGQINYTAVREINSQLTKQNDQINRARQDLNKAKQNNQFANQHRLQAFLKRAETNKIKMEKAFQMHFERSNAYFDAGAEYDPANFESIYIGSNMNVQFARNALIEGNIEKAQKLYQHSLERYNHITNHMPYFVQSRYWQGICHSGIADCLTRRLIKGETQLHKASMDSYHKALEHFEKYQEQDPVLREVYFEKFRAHLMISREYVRRGDRTKADEHLQKGIGELGLAIQNIKEGDHPIADSNHRFDVIRLISEYMRFSNSEKSAIQALELYNYVQEQKVVSGLLPFVPKTERHVKHALPFLVK